MEEFVMLFTTIVNYFLNLFYRGYGRFGFSNFLEMMRNDWFYVVSHFLALIADAVLGLIGFAASLLVPVLLVLILLVLLVILVVLVVLIIVNIIPKKVKIKQ